METSLSRDTLSFAGVVIGVIEVVMHVIGALLSGCLIYSIWMERVSLLKTKNGWAIFSLLICSFLWGLIISVLVSLFMSTSGHPGPTRFMSCQIMGVVIFMITGMTVVSHLLLCLDRYMIIVVRQELSTTSFFSVMGSFVVFLLTVNVLILNGESKFQPSEVGTWCAPDFSSRGIDAIGTMSVTIVPVLVLFVMIWMYARVYVVAIRINKESERVGNMSAKYETRFQKQEARIQEQVFYRCLIILGVFVFTFGFTFALFCYRAFSGRHVDFWVEGSATTMTISDLILTSLVIYFTSPRHKKAVDKHILRRVTEEESPGLPVSITQKTMHTARYEVSMTGSNLTGTSLKPPPTRVSFLVQSGNGFENPF